MKFALLFLTLLAISNDAISQTTSKIHKVIFQMSSADAEEQNGLLNNLKSLKEGWGDNVEIEVVAHGPGLTFLMKQKSANSTAIAQLIGEGVAFVACENTMKRKNIDKDQLLDGVGTVPMGIGEIIMKQEQGWSYIKANF